MKRVLCLLLAVVMAVCMAGCSTKEYTYGTEAGDMLNFTFDASDGYDIEFGERFTIAHNKELQTIGEFLSFIEYDYMRSLVEQDVTAEVEEIETPYEKCFFWRCGDKEFNIMFVVDNSHTAVLMRNGVSEESAKECFNRLTVKAG